MHISMHAVRCPSRTSGGPTRFSEGTKTNGAECGRDNMAGPWGEQRGANVGLRTPAHRPPPTARYHCTASGSDPASPEAHTGWMVSSDGLGALSILNDDSLRLILLDESLTDSLHCLASSSTQLLRRVLESRRPKKLTLDLGDIKLSAKWGEWLQQASGLHLQLDARRWTRVTGGDFRAGGVTGQRRAQASAILALLLPSPNAGISALTVHLDVSNAHGTEGLWHGTSRASGMGRGLSLFHMGLSLAGELP